MPTASAPGLQGLVVTTGSPGAGKSTALAVFEAAGYFCVDKLPVAIAEHLAPAYAERDDLLVEVSHRDIAKRQELVG